MFVKYRFTTLGVFWALLDFGPILRSKLRGRAARQMAQVGSLETNHIRGYNVNLDGVRASCALLCYPVLDVNV